MKVVLVVLAILVSSSAFAESDLPSCYLKVDHQGYSTPMAGDVPVVQGLYPDPVAAAKYLKQASDGYLCAFPNKLPECKVAVENGAYAVFYNGARIMLADYVELTEATKYVHALIATGACAAPHRQ